MPMHSKPKSQADAARNQVSEETLRLQRAVTQMQAAHDVAEIEYEIAQKNIEAVETGMKSSTANLHDLDNARTQSSEKLIALQDVSFELERNQIALLRATGNLEAWALGNRRNQVKGLTDASFAPLAASNRIFDDEPA